MFEYDKSIITTVECVAFYSGYSIFFGGASFIELMSSPGGHVSVADLGGVRRFRQNPPFWLIQNRLLYQTTVLDKVLVFMEPSLPSSYKKTQALAHLRVILNEY